MNPMIGDDNNVAKRSPTLKSEEDEENINNSLPVQSSPSQPPVVEKHSQINDSTKVEPTKIYEDPSQPDQSWLLTTGHVTGSTLLQSMSVTKVTVKLRGVKSDREVISLPESTKLKGCYLDSAVYMSPDGSVDVLLASTLNKDIILKPGTQIGIFQVCEHPIHIINDTEDITNNEKSFVGSIQSDTGDLEWKFRNHLKSTCHPELQRELINLFIKHRDAVAFPGDALGKTNVLKHKIKLREGTQPIYIPASHILN